MKTKNQYIGTVEFNVPLDTKQSLKLLFLITPITVIVLFYLQYLQFYRLQLLIHQWIYG